MAGSSLLVLIDDIALLLDDVAVMSKVAAKKTAGVLGDDLALNAQQVVGVKADRELPVVWAVAKGSLLNKVILVPAALAISAFAPWAVTPLLMAGGAFLCFEGVEKLLHPILQAKGETESHHAQLVQAVSDDRVDLVAYEKDKIKGAVRTDFILSAEIIAIALATVAGKPFLTQLMVLSILSLVVTVGVYGLVAAIVKMDDAGLYLSQGPSQDAPSAFRRRLGRGLLVAAPLMMKTLSVVGTAAMFLVGGGILMHGLPFAHDLVHGVTHAVAAVPVAGGVLATLAPIGMDGLGGILAGLVALGAVKLGKALMGALRRG